MACDGQSEVNLLVGDKLPALSERGAMLALAGTYGASVSLNAGQALTLAIQNKLPALSERQLDQVLLAVLC